MKNLLLCAVLAFYISASGQSIYFPPPGLEWEERSPSELGLNESLIDSALMFAMENEYSGSRDLRIAILEGFAREPYHKILGPTKKRGGPAGMLMKDGYIVAKWGDIDRVDMTFSVTKSYLSTVAGVAIQKGIIRNVHDHVQNYVWDGTFEGEHNGQITWDHLLTQSSDWTGELFGTKDWADRPPREGGIDDWKMRELRAPGTVMEYNDVRVNVLAYALLQAWRQPLPKVLKREIMDPIGASSTWRWYGYASSWVNVDGLKVQSVSGGGHSGGGIFISARDHARFGLLFMNGGKWKDRQILSEEWIATVQQPSTSNSSYGYMWWLNTNQARIPGAPEHLYYAAGFGGNFIIIDDVNNIVMVTRWLEPRNLSTFVQYVMKAIE